MNQLNIKQTLEIIKQKAFSDENLKALAIAGLAVMALSVTGEAMAGNTGAEFKPAWDKFEDLIGGFGGKMIAGVSLAIALIGSALRFNPYLVFGALGTGITAAFGTAVLGKVVTAII